MDAAEIGFRPSSFEGARSEVEFAYENVPFYSGHLERAGIRVEDVVTPADFRQIPPTRSIDYRRNFPQGVLARGRTLSEPLTLKSQSSGAGGERLTTVAYIFSLARRRWATLSANKKLARALPDLRSHRPVRYAAPNCSNLESATPFTTISDRTLADGTIVLPASDDVLATPDQLVQQAIDELKTFSLHWFDADATHLAFLVRQLRARQEKPPPVAAVALTYTLATAVARRQLLEYFGSGIPMAQIVSMSELGWIATECPAQRMHVNNVTFYPEFLVGSRPARAGERAELVITSVDDRLSPHLRYRTGDIYTVEHGLCTCGSDLPLARHEGHRQTMLRVVRDGDVTWVSPRDVDDAVGPDPSIDVYKLHQLGSGDLQFHYIRSQSKPVDERSLRERLMHVLGSDAKLAIEAVSYIPASRSGKFASCTSDISDEEDNK